MLEGTDRVDEVSTGADNVSAGATDKPQTNDTSPARTREDNKGDNSGDTDKKPRQRHLMVSLQDPGHDDMKMARPKMVMNVSISGNAAQYSTVRVNHRLNGQSPEIASEAFKHISRVRFKPDGTVSFYHDGEITPGVWAELRQLGQVLESGEILVAMGIENTLREAILVSVSEIGVEVLPVIIKPTSKDAFRKRSFIHRLSKVIHLETTWFKSGPRTNPQLPRSLGVVDPGNAGYNLFRNNVE